MATDLLSHAVDAEKNLEALATGLGQQGIDPQVVATVTKMADACRKLVKILGKGQEHTANNAPPSAPPADQVPPQAQPPVAVGPPPRETMQSAAQYLHDTVRQRAQGR